LRQKKAIWERGKELNIEGSRYSTDFDYNGRKKAEVKIGVFGKSGLSFLRESVGKGVDRLAGPLPSL